MMFLEKEITKMGSFYVTCNISQLPITGGDPVRVLFLGKCPYSMDPRTEDAIGEGNNSREGCYPTDFWYPRTVPLKARYYDYGQVDHVEEGLCQTLFWKQLKEDLWAVNQGPNPYHDPPSSIDMNWDRMWDVVTEGRLRLRREYVSRETGHKAVPVCAVMVREDVWQAMLALPNPRMGDVREVVGDRVRYKEVILDLTFYKNQLNKAVKQVLANPLSEWDREYIKAHPARHSFRYSTAFRELFLDQSNPADALGLEFYLEGLIEAIEKEEFTLNSPEIQDVLQRVAEMMHIKSLYTALRRTWHPGTGQGSQSAEFLAEAKFHHAMALIGYRAADREQQRRAKWESELDEMENVIPSKPVERMNETFLSSLPLPETD